jgi:hypothetical protein
VLSFRRAVNFRMGAPEIVISSELLHRPPLPRGGSDPRLAIGLAGRVLQPAGTRQHALRAIP